MKLFVVFHNDIEDSKWVRGVCSTRELAERLRQSPEKRWGEYVERHSDTCCDIQAWTLDDLALMSPVVFDA